MRLNLGGVVHLSTVDWAGLASTVVFFRGCPLRCPHCQNRELQEGENLAELSFRGGEVMEAGPSRFRRQITLDEAASRTAAEPAISAVVLSGGEPLMQPEAARGLASGAKRLGIKVGLETCGYYPGELRWLLEDGLLDKVFLDVKAALRDPGYERATGRAKVAPRVLESLRICMSSGISLEVRTTVFPGMPSPSEVREIAEALSALKSEFPGHGLELFVLQQGQPREAEFEPVPSGKLRELAASLQSLVDVRVRDAPRARPSRDR